MNRYYNKFRRFCAFLIGAVFFISGILKLMDPVGAGLVVDEYYRLAGLDVLHFSAKFVGVLMALFESILGVLLMTGLWRRVVAIITIVVLCFFTILTLVLLILNPEMDCGCFGEAVHLTHLQTFIKNVVLCIVAVIAFTPINRLGRPKRRKYVSFAIVTFSVLLFAVYSWIYIPIVDFTAFKSGARLASSVQDAPDIYKATFIYEKDGEQRSFNLEQLPDSTWTYVRTDTQQVERVDEEIPVLSFSTEEGEYMDELAANGRVMLISIYDSAELFPKKWKEVSDFLTDAFNAGFKPIVLVSEEFGKVVAEWMENAPENATSLVEQMYSSDYKTLITLNRSNGGATFIQDGTIIEKWARTDLPDIEELQEIAAQEPAEFCHDDSNSENLVFQAFLLYVFAVLFFV